MSSSSLPGLCDSTSQEWLLWDFNLIWNNQTPDFTLCFQYTILQWIPIIYLIIFSPIILPILYSQPTVYYKSRGKFNIFKSFLILILFFIQVLNLSVSISDNINSKIIPNALFLQAVLSILTYLYLVFLNYYYYKKGNHTSGVLFFYWMLQLIVFGFLFYSRIVQIQILPANQFRTVTTIIEFCLVFLLFLLNCFADKSVFRNRIKNAFDDEEEPLLKQNESFIENVTIKPCPEIQSSYLSRLTYTWLNGMVLQGYRRALTSDDLFNLRERDTCRKIIPKLEINWEKECRRVEKLNNKKKAPKRFQTRSGQVGYQSLSSNENEAETSFSQSQSGSRRSNSSGGSNKSKVKSPSFLRALFHTIGYEYMGIGLLKLIYDLVTFLQPQLLGLLITFIETKNDYLWHGIVISICLFLIAMVRTVIFQNYWNGCYVTGMNARTAVIGVVYRKALRLSSSSRKETTVGEIVNLMSVDAQKLQDIPGFLHLIWSAPITMAIAIYFLWQELGPSVLAGLGLMILLIPLNAFLGSKVKKLQLAQMKMKDKRIKLMNEILSGMKILKLYAWEKSFEAKITELRDQECRVLRSATYLNAVGAVSWFCAPFLVALCSFAAFILSSPDNLLTANKAFVSLSLFNILNFPMSMLPGTIVYGIQAYVSINRINKYLVGEELNPYNVDISPPTEAPIKIENGEFSWSNEGVSTLTNINLEVKEGSLIAVVGTVGSGKSSLTAALIGEMHKIQGNVFLRGSLAYVPQQAWCQNASLQDNITFAKPLQVNKYNKVIEACALLDDLKVLPAGDQTEIGEKGINLSGGQKQRISLARAVYQDASIYILDDPLSAVDSHVGKHIFNQVIGENGLLSNKTRILVTHNLTFLPKVDQIIVMTDGEISEAGSYRELINNNGAFSEYIRTYLDQEEEERGEEEDSEDEARELKAELRRSLSRASSQVDSEFESSSSKRTSSLKHHRRTSSVRLSKSRSMIADEEAKQAAINKKKKLIQDEAVEIGGVGFGVFISYLKSTTFFWASMVIGSYGLFLACSVSANLYLSYWSEGNSGPNASAASAASKDSFLGAYGGLGGGQALFILIENFSLAYGTFLASRSLHYVLLQNILRAPNSFFDTTPLGRILNRIGKDIDTVDVNIPTAIRIWLATAAGVIGTIIVISIASPFFLLAMVPLGVFYYFIQRFYICTSRQLKRIDSIKRSPIYSHFSESIIGVTSIRAYKVNDRFIDKCDALTDDNQMAWYPNIISYRWLQFHLELIGNLIILVTGFISVFTKDYIGAGLAGLSVSYSLQVTGALNFMVRMTCDLESYTVAIERIKEYAEVQSEAEWIVENCRPPENWPEQGRVEFRNYSVRYRPGLDLVLKNMNLKVEPGQKLGIVGRTGAGKSSLALALFRLIEPAEGSIIIDGKDVSKMGLHDLRSKLTIIPQDPVLFSGTLRMNLDPFEMHSDGELWNALDLAHLKSFVSKTTEGLDYSISEGGENLSVGQRQLVCLARALLKKTKILVLDEATAAVDLETDELIQNSIRRQFKDCTVLTIAHRLNTIMDYDKVLVLEMGKIKEIDSPENLLANEKSLFFSMAHDAGLA